MECSWCGKYYEKSYKGYCSERCWGKDWADRPRTVGRFYDESPDNVYDNISNEDPFNHKQKINN